MNAKVLAEALEAYADCHGDRPFEETEKIRKLSWKASEPVSVIEARDIMRAAVPGGYNQFDANVLWQLPRGAKVWLARDRSVCVYVEPNGTPMPAKGTMREDENTIRDGQVCLWWD